MNEELNRREAELNDAALEGVGGGARERSIANAKLVCGCCPVRGMHRGATYCSGGEAALAEYLDTHDPFSRWNKCPFLKET